MGQLTRTRRFAIWTSIGALSIVSVSCGSDDNSSTDTAASATTAAGAATPTAAGGATTTASGSETTLKRFYREPGDTVRLQPANSALKPIFVPAREVQIQGRLLAVLRKYK